MLHGSWEKGDFSTPLRFGRNDGGCGPAFLSLEEGDFFTPQRFDRNDDRGSASIVISSGAACRYGADGKRSHDTLSREISRVMLPVPSEEGDFSTLLRCGRNDGGRGPAFLKSAPPKGETTHYILRVASAPSKCVRCAPKGATASSEPFEPYERKAKHVTLTLYSSPKRAIPQPSGPKAPSNLRTLRTFGPEARQPSRRRRVQWRGAPPQVSSFLSPRFTANRFRFWPVSFMRASTEGRPVSSSAFRTMYSQALASSKAW